MPTTLEIDLARVGESLGLRFRPADIPALKSYLAYRRRALSLGRAEDYLDLLSNGSGPGQLEREQVITRFTTGESYFLRDAKQLDVVMRQLVPELMRRKESARRLRFWSAGCSTGEEPYTLAMLLLEQAPELAGWDVEIIASDINSRVLAFARRGAYTEWSFRAMDRERRARYFRLNGHEWQIDSALKQRVRFCHIDLVGAQLPDTALGIADIDLILCRNVFIYMNPAAVASVTKKFSTVLADGGYLVTGHGELLGHNTDNLRTRVFADSVVLRKDHQIADRQPSLPVVEGLVGGTGVSFSQPDESLMRSLLPIPALCMPKPLSSRTDTKVPPTFDSLMQQAWREADRGLVDIAGDSCRRALELAPFNPWPYYLQAQLAQIAGDTEQARILLGKAIYLDPQLVAAYLELAGLLEASSPARAKSLLRAACRELRRLPSDSLIKPYADTCAAAVLAYIEQRLSAPSRVAQLLTGDTPAVSAA